MRGHRLPDDLVVRRVLARDVAEVIGVCEPSLDGRLREDLAVGDRPPGNAVGDPAVGRDGVFDVRPEERGSRLDKRDAARGTGAQQTVKLGGDAAAVHGVGEAVHGEVLGTSLRVVERHVLPVHLELVRHDLGERGADVLAHLGFHDMNGGMAIRHHREPDGRREGLRRFRGGTGPRDRTGREADAEREPRSAPSTEHEVRRDSCVSLWVTHVRPRFSDRSGAFDGADDCLNRFAQRHRFPSMASPDLVPAGRGIGSDQGRRLHDLP